ncbi:hypothetical protein LCGC14_0258160 [marine sediment metagenome]|uniref:Uncharacterized protein n=1 Tax=marine sediment metagenome TaxID=412755 RepID=A0A0F9UJ48_9ZZZZ
MDEPKPQAETVEQIVQDMKGAAWAAGLVPDALLKASLEAFVDRLEASRVANSLPEKVWVKCSGGLPYAVYVPGSDAHLKASADEDRFGVAHLVTLHGAAKASTPQQEEDDV